MLSLKTVTLVEANVVEKILHVSSNDQEDWLCTLSINFEFLSTCLFVFFLSKPLHDLSKINDVWLFICRNVEKEEATLSVSSFLQELCLIKFERNISMTGYLLWKFDAKGLLYINLL